MSNFTYNEEEPVYMMRNKVETMILEIETQRRKNMLKLLNELFGKKNTFLNEFTFLKDTYFKNKEDKSFEIIDDNIKGFSDETKEKINNIKKSDSKYVVYEIIFELLKLTNYTLIPTIDKYENNCFMITKKKSAKKFNCNFDKKDNIVKIDKKTPPKVIKKKTKDSSYEDESESE